VVARLRFPALALGLLALLAAMWGGLLRMGWNWPLLRPTLLTAHGPLMVAGFLGTVIGVERAVALNRPWTYIPPLLTALGGLALIAGLPSPIGPLLITLGSAGLVAVFVQIVRMHLAPFTATMAVGAVMWLVGNLLWLSGWPIAGVVVWWEGFLLLTIAGERLELGRILRPGRTVLLLFGGTVGLLLAGAALTLVNRDAGVRLAGVGMVALALWLLRHDVARHTVRKTGLTRFIALSLLTGYIWLGVGGVLGVLYGGIFAGPYYGATLHAVFIGFVISMIFGHAPIIFPAVSGRAIPFSPRFYSHLALLHLSLILRVAGDLAGYPLWRQWGGLLNAAALLLFLLNTALAVRRASSP